MASTDPTVLAELRGLVKDNILDPAVVVSAARSENSPLHSYFTWDDGEAAEQFRLIEARKLISVHVELLAPKSDPSPVFVSLRSDRPKGGGYRPMTHVLSRKALREQLLSDALKELEYFKNKYHMLTELAEVFAAIKKVGK